MRSSKSETNPKFKCSNGGGGDVSAAPNKANPGRGGLGIDYGLLIIGYLTAKTDAHSVDCAPNKANSHDALAV
jgi:hypothetical protein